MLNLLEYLTEEDRRLFESYIDLYGVDKSYYLGTDNYLADWNNSKKRLFHLLGGKLIYRFPINIEKNCDILLADMSTMITNSSFIEAILYRGTENTFYNGLYNDKIHLESIKGIFKDLLYLIKNLKEKTEKDIVLNASGFITVLDEDLIAEINAKFKPVKIPAGTKIMRAYSKVLAYFKVDKEILELFEEFRIAHSMVLNDRFFTGNGAISIHPLDFLTMSDNASNWSSCMSWVNSGCYHVGTVEMMNSNNVVCCYLESKTPYYFNENNKEDAWTNKKFRQLFYITNDIIVGGKSYPYATDELTKEFLNEIRELAKINLHRTYEFGPELYKDMVHINTRNEMLSNKWWAGKDHPGFKHNIIFDSKGMYNDMLNASHFNYWCVRNKVKRTKVISYSGKAPCLCCGDSVIEYNESCEWDYEDGIEEYNARYDGVRRVVCYDCWLTKTCESCERLVPTKKIEVSNFRYESLDTVHYCERCYDKKITTCKHCGCLLLSNGSDTTTFMFLNKDNELLNPNDEGIVKIIPVSGCYSCIGAYSKRKGYFDNAINTNICKIISEYLGVNYSWVSFFYFDGTNEQAQEILKVEGEDDAILL